MLPTPPKSSETSGIMLLISRDSEHLQFAVAARRPSQIVTVRSSTPHSSLRYPIAARCDPRDYNITITRKGEKLDTEYTVMASPKTPLPPELKRMYEEENIDLEALYDGGNPFDATERSASLDGQSFPTNTAEARAAQHDDDIDPGDVPF